MKTENILGTISVKAAVIIAPNLIVDITGALGNATNIPLGVSTTTTDLGEQCPVVYSGVKLVLSGAAVTAGDLVKSDANAKAIPTLTNDKLVLGKALDAATAADELIRVKLF